MGILTYLNVPQHSYKIIKLSKPGDLTIISFRYVTIADHDGLLALCNFIEEQEKRGVKVIVAGVKRNMKKKLNLMKMIKMQLADRSWDKVFPRNRLKAE